MTFDIEAHRAELLAALACGEVEGVALVTIAGPDDNAPHGANTEEEMCPDS